MLWRAAGIEHSIRPLGEQGTEGDRKRNQERNWKRREGAGPCEPLDPRGRAGRGWERNDGVGEGCSSSLPGILVPWTLLPASHLIVLQGSYLPLCFPWQPPCLYELPPRWEGGGGGVSRLWPSCSQVPELGQKLNRLRVG